ncbi:MAG: 4Fe-4S ferredoxin, partial [Desulforhopalus sp.]
MIDAIKDKVNELLDSGEIKGFLGLAMQNGHVAPHFYQKGDDLGDMVLGDVDKPGDARYPLNKYLMNIAGAYPKDTLGVLVRGCDERGLNTLYTWNQLKKNKVVPVGIGCPQELADSCECSLPYPENMVAGEKAEGCVAASVSEVEALVLSDKFSYWMDEFVK